MKSFIKKWEEKFPILFSVVVFVLFEIIHSCIGEYFKNYRIFGYWRKHAVKQFIVAVLAVLFLIAVGKGKSVLKSRKGFFKSLGVGAYELVLLSLSFATILIDYHSKSLSPIKDIIAFSLCMLLIGIAEEVMCRGIIADSILNKYGNTRKGIIFSVFISGLIFGLAHLSNLTSGISPVGVLIQTAQAISAGMFFSAVYMRTHNIFAVIFLHAAEDFVGLSASGLWGIGTFEGIINNYSLINLLPVLIYLIPTIYILRKSKLNEYLDERTEK